jgi:hypothetical protein
MNANTNTNAVWTNSLFVPAIDFNITKNDLKDYFEKSTESKVSRVDFVSFNSDKGTGRRAFIHFSHWNPSNRFAKLIRAKIESNGYFEFSLPKNSHIHLRLLINKNPVPETEITMPQIASNMDFMAEKIRLQEEEIQTLKEEMAGMKQFMENMYYMMTSQVYVTK